MDIEGVKKAMLVRLSNTRARLEVAKFHVDKANREVDDFYTFADSFGEAGAHAKLDDQVNWELSSINELFLQLEEAAHDDS